MPFNLYGWAIQLWICSSILSPPSFLLFPLPSMVFNLGNPVEEGVILFYLSPFIKHVATHFILSVDLCVLFNLTFCEAQPQQPSEVTIQTQMQFGSFTVDFSVHKIKPLVLVRPRTVESGCWWELCRGCEKIVILLFNFQQMKKEWLFKSKTWEKAPAVCVFWSLEQKLHTFMEMWRHFQNFRPIFLPRYFLWCWSLLIYF